MDIHPEKPFQSFFCQLLPFLLSFLDDALLLLLSRLGLHVQGLQWLSPVILGSTVLYWAGQILQNWYYKRQRLETWQR